MIRIVKITGGVHLLDKTVVLVVLIRVAVVVDRYLSILPDRISSPEGHVFEEHGKVDGVRSVCAPDDIVGAIEDAHVQLTIVAHLESCGRIAGKILADPTEIEISGPHLQD